MPTLIDVALAAVWIVVLHVSALGYSGTIVADAPKHQVAFATKAACDGHVPSVKRDVPIPALVSLKKITCRKMELKK